MLSRKTIRVALLLLPVVLVLTGFHSPLLAQTVKNLAPLPASATSVATLSVVRIVCSDRQVAGTGFLHRSGNVITAGHVVDGSLAKNIHLFTSLGETVNVTSYGVDRDHDIALIKTDRPIKVPALRTSSQTNFELGMPVIFWGFPGGYGGQAPLLSVGYLSGVDTLTNASGKPIHRYVINGAFNSGNSGGPLLDANGDVMGVVSSKLAPVPAYIQQALISLSRQASGQTFLKPLPGGRTVSISQGQLIAEVLEYLRGQTQLVIGYAVTLGDLNNFFKTNGVTP